MEGDVGVDAAGLETGADGGDEVFEAGAMEEE